MRAQGLLVLAYVAAVLTFAAADRGYGGDHVSALILTSLINDRGCDGGAGFSPAELICTLLGYTHVFMALILAAFSFKGLGTAAQTKSQIEPGSFSQPGSIRVGSRYIMLCAHVVAYWRTYLLLEAPFLQEGLRWLGQGCAPVSEA